jgi:hypothetical protein
MLVYKAACCRQTFTPASRLPHFLAACHVMGKSAVSIRLSLSSAGGSTVYKRTQRRLVTKHRKGSSDINYMALCTRNGKMILKWSWKRYVGDE